MARLVFGMNQSLDGYVDHMAFAPCPTLFRLFIEEAQGQAGSVYGRQMYEVMRYCLSRHFTRISSAAHGLVRTPRPASVTLRA